MYFGERFTQTTGKIRRVLKRIESAFLVATKSVISVI